MSGPGALERRAWELAGAVVDPELPAVTIADLGVLRSVRADRAIDGDGVVEVTLTPTYSGCPAMATIAADVERALREGGFTRVEVRTTLSPPWSSDFVTEEGRRKLAAEGIAPPAPFSPNSGAAGGGVELVACPRCGSANTRLVSFFGATACRSLRACRRCLEPFEHFKVLR